MSKAGHRETPLNCPLPKLLWEHNKNKSAEPAPLRFASQSLFCSRSSTPSDCFYCEILASESNIEECRFLRKTRIALPKSPRSWCSAFSVLSAGSPANYLPTAERVRFTSHRTRAVLVLQC